MTDTIHELADKISEKEYGVGTAVNVEDKGIAATYIDFDANDSSFGESVSINVEDSDWYATGFERFENDKRDFDYRVWYTTEENENPWYEFYDQKELSDAEIAKRLERLAERAESSLAEHDCKALAESLKLIDDDSDGSQSVVIAHGIGPNEVDYRVGEARDVGGERDFTANGIYAPVDTASAEKIKTQWHCHKTDIDSLEIHREY